MSGDDLPGNGGALKLLEVFDRLRSDVKADFDRFRAESRDRDAELEKQLDKHEERMTAAVQEVRSDVQEFVIAHGNDHDTERSNRDAAHKRFEDYIETAKLTKARTDGMLAVGLYVLSVLGKHWQLVVTAVFAILAAVGAINIQFGTTVGEP